MKDVSVSVSLIAGGISGLSNCVLLQPLDLVYFVQLICLDKNRNPDLI